MDVEPYPEDVEVDPYPEEVVVEPYWPVAPREPKAAAVAASISGLSSFMIWGKAVKAKSLKPHLVDNVVRLAGSLADSLVDSGAGLLGHVGALLLVLGAALLLVLRGASLAGSCSADVLSHLLAHLLSSGFGIIRVSLVSSCNPCNTHSVS